MTTCLPLADTEVPGWWNYCVYPNVQLRAGKNEITLSQYSELSVQGKGIKSKPRKNVQPLIDYPMVYEGIDYSINFAARRNKSTLDAVLDEGQVFALHEESGLSYGWAKNRMGTYQVIKSRQAPDATQLAGVEWTKRNRDNYWEIKIPNGTYNVHLVTGGIASPDELERVAGWDIDGAGHSINGAQIIKDARVPYVNDYLVEGIRVQDTEPDRIYSFIDCKVDVKDGRLTIKPGPDAVSPRLAGLKISQCQ